MKKNRNGIGIQVGATTESIATARAAIMAILETGKVADETKQEALRTLATLCRVDHTTITGCTVNA